MWCYWGIWISYGYGLYVKLSSISSSWSVSLLKLILSNIGYYYFRIEIILNANSS